LRIKFNVESQAGAKLNQFDGQINELGHITFPLRSCFAPAQRLTIESKLIPCLSSERFSRITLDEGNQEQITMDF